MTARQFFRFSAALLVLSGITPAFAQPLPERISSTPRSDGKGFVVRFHNRAAPDSFRVYQSSPELVQIAFYHPLAETSGVRLPVERPEIEKTELWKIHGGLGINLRLKPGQNMLATSYVDANKKDLLIPLTKVSSKDISKVFKDLKPVDWTLLKTNGPTDSVAAEKNEPNKPANNTVDQSYSSLKNRQMLDVIVIDAGHGGKDPGAVGKITYEKKVTLGVALKLGAMIKKELPYVKIVYTRDDDTFVELDNRGHIANKAEGDLFISIHCNSVEKRKYPPRGASFYFLGMHRSEEAYNVMLRENAVVRLESQQNGKVTELSEEQLLLYELTNRGYMESAQAFSIHLDQQFTKVAKRKSLGIRQAGFMVLYYSSMPAVLIELGFISNPEEEKFMASEAGQKELANAILQSVLKYRDQLEIGKKYAN